MLQRLVHDLGTTVLMAEHRRLERVIQYADQVALFLVPGRRADARHPVRDHGRLPGVPAGGGPGPAGRLVPAPPHGARRTAQGGVPRNGAHGTRPQAEDRAADSPTGGRSTGGGSMGGGSTGDGPGLDRGPRRPPWPRRGAPARRPHHRPRRDHRADGPQRGREVHPARHAGRAGRTGGRFGPGSGAVPRRTAPRDLVRRVGLVPQEPRDLLYADTVAAECAGRPTRTRGPSPVPAGPWCPNCCRTSGTTPTPVTCRRGSGWRSRWPSS